MPWNHTLYTRQNSAALHALSMYWYVSQKTQQTRDVDPMLGYCWANEDGEPTLTQHWVNVTCLLGRRPLHYNKYAN